MHYNALERLPLLSCYKYRKFIVSLDGDPLKLPVGQVREVKVRAGKK